MQSSSEEEEDAAFGECSVLATISVSSHTLSKGYPKIRCSRRHSLPQNSRFLETPRRHVHGKRELSRLTRKVRARLLLFPLPFFFLF